LEEKDPRPAPKTQSEVYSRLIAMLHLRKPVAKHHRSIEEEVLVLRRPLLRLMRESRVIDGECVIVTASEKAAGELLLTVYSTKLSMMQSVMVDDRLAFELSQDADDEERDALRSGEVPKLMPYVVDRSVVAVLFWFLCFNLRSCRFLLSTAGWSSASVEDSVN
jgi:hypothetical protein